MGIWMDSNAISHSIRGLIELAVLSIESLAVLVILLAIVFGSVRYIIQVGRQIPDAYDHYKVQLGKALLLGLQLLVAADVVRTVALEPSLESVTVLGLLVLVRTFLSLSTVVEIEGRWPWSNPVEK